MQCHAEQFPCKQLLLPQPQNLFTITLPFLTKVDYRNYRDL